MRAVDEFRTSAICDLPQQLGEEGVFGQLASRETLENYAFTFGIATEGKTDEQLAQDIAAAGPCNWISQVKEWAKKDSKIDYLNSYVTSGEMEQLNEEIDEQNPLSPKLIDEIYRINQAIYAAPRVSESFVVYQGIPHKSYQAGQVFTIEVPKTSSFSLDVLSGNYIDFQVQPACCVAKIFVPVGAIATYHISEDRVIFPSGARFYVLTNPVVVDMSSNGKDIPVRYYELIYVDAPVEPEKVVHEPIVTLTRPTKKSTPYDELSPSDAYAITIIRNLPFPVSIDPYSVLADADEADPSYMSRIEGIDFDLENPVEVRLFLASTGENVSAWDDYDSEQMQQIFHSLE